MVVMELVEVVLETKPVMQMVIVYPLQAVAVAR